MISSMKESLDDRVCGGLADIPANPPRGGATPNRSNRWRRVTTALQAGVASVPHARPSGLTESRRREDL